jgi:hypothetical protein
MVAFICSKLMQNGQNLHPAAKIKPCKHLTNAYDMHANLSERPVLVIMKGNCHDCI